MALALAQIPFYLLRGLQHLARRKLRLATDHCIEEVVFGLKAPRFGFDK